MSGTHLTFTASTTDEPNGVSLYLRWDDGMWFVSDVVGLRYGAGASIKDALEMWASCAQDALDEDEDKLADPYLGEVRRYRRALGMGR